MSLALIPQPRKIRQLSGAFSPAGHVWHIGTAALAHPAVIHKLKVLGLRYQPAPRAGLTVTAGSPDLARLNVPDHSEGYALLITPAGLALRGHDADGLFWGLVTLEQLLEQSDALPALQIADWPQFAFRCHHDDISRKQVSTVEDFKRIIRLLSRWKINHYTLYMEDMLHLASFPDIGEGRGKLMPDEVKAIVREGQLHNVTIFPTYSLIGHQENLLQLPRYAHLGRKVFHSPSSLDPDNPAVRTFLRKAIADVCRLFPARYFHMCFDETQGVTEEQFLRHANWCAAELVKHGKRPLMWVDMIYNHFGYAKLRKLHPAIIPVNWQYGDTRKAVPHQKELMRQGREVWGLAAYQSTCTFLPDSGASRDNMEGWVREAVRRPFSGLACSIWGDDGYENHRDLCWNQYAAFGEHAWSGPAADRATLDDRFNRLFYGAPLPRLQAITRDLPKALSMPPHLIWRMHRKNAFSLARHAASDRGMPARLDRDEALLRSALKDLDACRREARSQQAHLDHVQVALERTLSVVHRLQFAYRYVKGLSPSRTRTQIAALVAELRQVRRNYARAWLRHNKPENIEVSLAVFDRVIDGYRQFAQMGRAGAADHGGRYRPLDLSRQYGASFLDIAGIPLGPALINGIPFQFAGLRRTHATVGGGHGTIDLRLGPTFVKDLHVIAAARKTADGQPHPALRLELLRNGRVVFTEDLLSIRHLCDWWAPFGEHMWAGGGLRYVDPLRVRPALRPDHYYGLMELHNFGIVGRIRADRLRLSSLTDDGVQLFALTVES